MKLITALLILSLSVPSFAQRVQKISKSVPSPIDGWVVTDEFIQQAAKDKDTLEITQQKVQVLENLSGLDKAETEFYQKRSDALRKSLEKSENSKFWSNMGHFVLGVVLTGVAAKAAIEASK